ncbi:4'-phosphopantetheinyl transferase family protein [Atlantibacter hermannii]|uniref:4'-phosphopantetheinyl transferase family protein n=1 Tax=Atlantibacter hermannii TaxID=565 RepID=UPI0028AA29C8|nr:4'-phosphopantetheinyl transferase superfamily protein [Atlantibacter hermannii]
MDAIKKIDKSETNDMFDIGDATPGFMVNYKKIIIPSFSGVCCQSNFYVEQYTEALARKLLQAELKPELTKSVRKRKAEFVAGRCLARQALQQLGADDYVVDVGQHRTPVWPKGFVGSISHTNTLAVCAVAYSKDIQRLGVDIEEYIANEIAHSVFASVVTEAERILFKRYPRFQHVLLPVIFSAKESLFKALFPSVGYYFGFEVARLKEINFSAGTLVIELTTCLTPELAAGSCFNGLFRLHNAHVFTMVMECASTPHNRAIHTKDLSA